jgi:predicted hydrocarbon binding protein
MSEKSGLFYPNLMARIYIQALEEVMGKNGLNALLNLSGLSYLIDNYPPANLNREFDFADFTALSQGIIEMYGPRGGRGLALRAGRAAFAEGLSKFGATAGAADLAFKVLPMNTKVKVGLKAMADSFNKFSDQRSEVKDEGDHFDYFIRVCPMCWHHKSDRSVCYGAVGILQEGLRWVSGGKDFKVEAVQCLAKGDEIGLLRIDKEPLD